jgi:hypothetical protein
LGVRDPAQQHSGGTRGQRCSAKGAAQQRDRPLQARETACRCRIAHQFVPSFGCLARSLPFFKGHHTQSQVSNKKMVVLLWLVNFFKLVKKLLSGHSRTRRRMGKRAV